MKEENKHFAICPTCGFRFDMRDLPQVAEHFHERDIDIDLEQLKGISARRMGDPGRRCESAPIAPSRRHRMPWF